MIPLVLAHGALGYWDETIYIAVAVIFFAITIYSWYRTRRDFPDMPDENISHNEQQPQTRDPDTFKLD